MFRFIHSVPKPGEPVRDAGAGTFYSAMSNVDLEIEDSNPYAVALRALRYQPINSSKLFNRATGF
jgi:hypothetical protein